MAGYEVPTTRLRSGTRHRQSYHLDPIADLDLTSENASQAAAAFIDGLEPKPEPHSDIDSDSDYGSERLPRPKRLKNNKRQAVRSPESVVSDLDFTAGDEHFKPKPTAAVSLAEGDIWAVIFEILKEDCRLDVLAVCTRINSDIGFHAARALYMSSPKLIWGLHSEPRARRMLSVILSTNEETMYPYCNWVADLSTTDLAWAPRHNLIGDFEFNDMILDFTLPESIGNLRGSDLVNGYEMVSAAISHFIARHADFFPRVTALETAVLGLIVPLPLAFEGLRELTLDSAFVDAYGGTLIDAGCPRLETLNFSIQTIDNERWNKESTLGKDRVRGVYAFLDSLQPNSLKHFGLFFVGLESPPKRGNDLEAGLRECESRGLLRSLQRFELVTLRLVRLHPVCYFELSRYTQVYDSLEELDIVLPDRYWGNIGGALLTGLFNGNISGTPGDMAGWLQSCKKLHTLRWVSYDQGKYSNATWNSPQDYGSWSDVLAVAIGSEPLRQLRKLDISLRNGKLAVFTAIGSNLTHLEELRVYVDKQIDPALTSRLTRKERLDEPMALANAIQLIETLERVNVYYRLFNPCLIVNFKRDSYEKPYKDYSTLGLEMPYDAGPRLRELVLKCDKLSNGHLFWKWTSRFPWLRNLSIDAEHSFTPGDLAEFLRSIGADIRDKSRCPVVTMPDKVPGLWHMLPHRNPSQRPQDLQDPMPRMKKAMQKDIKTIWSVLGDKLRLDWPNPPASSDTSSVKP